MLACKLLLMILGFGLAVIIGFAHARVETGTYVEESWSSSQENISASKRLSLHWQQAASSQLQCSMRCSSSSIGCLAFAFAAAQCRMQNSLPATACDYGTATFAWQYAHIHGVNNCPGMAKLGNKLYCIIQQRLSDSVSFERRWAEYEAGFGDSHNFWMGLSHLHSLTAARPLELRIEFRDWPRDNKTKAGTSASFLHHANFSVGPASDKFRLRVGPLIASRSAPGIADRLSFHNGAAFSTYDVSGEANANLCSSNHHGYAGWWFKNCATINPNGRLFDTRVASTKAASLNTHGDWLSVRSMRIMLLVTSDML